MSFHQIFKIRSLWPNYGSILSYTSNENVQLYPIPLLSSCMHAIKTISELTFGELDLQAQGQAYRSNHVNKHFELNWKQVEIFVCH